MIDPTLRSLEALVAFDNVEKAISGVRAAEHVIPWTEDLGRQGMQLALRDRDCEGRKLWRNLRTELGIARIRIPRC